MVNWILHKEILPIKKEHLESFLNVWLTNLGFPNFRECQPLCGRRVVRNFHYENEKDFDHSTMKTVTHPDHNHLHHHEHVHEHRNDTLVK